MADGLDSLLLQTLDLLEWRLQRLEFVLSGTAPSPQTDAAATPVSSRIQKLENALGSLASKSRAIEELLALQSKHPDFLSSHSSPDLILNEEKHNDDAPPTAAQLPLVLAAAPSYQSTASQLTSLDDLPLPPTSSFTSLVALSPRIAEVQNKQAEQALEISDLRQRSARAMLRWNEIMVLGQGRCWAEWEDRVKKCERGIRREERARQEESGVA